MAFSLSSFCSLLICVSVSLAVCRAWDYDYDYRINDEDNFSDPLPAPENNVNWFLEPETNDQSPFGCAAVSREISSCQDYLNGREDSPTSACCENIVNLWITAVDVGSQRICNCTKDLRGSFLRSRAENEIYNKCDYEDTKNFRIPISEQQCSSGSVDKHDYDYSRPSAPETGDEFAWVCPAVTDEISACREYLNGHEDLPSPACCPSIKSLAGIGVEVGFKRYCGCLKDLQGSFVQSRAEDEIFKECGFVKSYIPISEQRCSEY